MGYSTIYHLINIYILLGNSHVTFAYCHSMGILLLLHLLYVTHLYNSEKGKSLWDSWVHNWGLFKGPCMGDIISCIPCYHWYYTFVSNSSARAPFFNQGGTVSLFVSRLASCILNLANKHGITLIPAYICTLLNVEADYLQGKVSFKMPSSSSHCSSGVPNVGLITVDMFAFLSYPNNVSIIMVCWDVLLYIFSSCISSPRAVKVSGRTYHRSIQASNSSCTLLDGGSLVTHNSQHIGRHSSILKDLISNVLVGWVLRGLPSLHLMHWLLSDKWHIERGSLSQAVKQWHGWLKCLQQRLATSVRNNRQVGVLKGVYQTMPFCPWINFLGGYYLASFI